MLKIALPNKGRLADDTRELFGDAGLPVRTRGDRALSASLGGEFEALFVRAQDIPEFVADGVADAGVTGWDLVCEAGRRVEARLDLGFGELGEQVAFDSLVRDGEHARDGAGVFGVVQGEVAEQGVDGGQAVVAGGGAVVPVAFEVF